MMFSFYWRYSWSYDSVGGVVVVVVVAAAAAAADDDDDDMSAGCIFLD